jgi:hypothetical protein
MAIGETAAMAASVWLMWRNGGEENRRRHVVVSAKMKSMAKKNNQ